MVVAIILLAVLLAVAVYIIWNLNKKVQKAEDIIDSQVDYLRKVSLAIQESNVYINQLDEKGHFRADDEIGTFFDFLKEIQDIINSFRLPQDYGKETK
jgi:hypothetical protein